MPTPTLSHPECSLCGDTHEKYDVTGIKVIKKKELPYQLCRPCCSKIRSHNAQIPQEAKKRVDLWEKIWKNVEKQSKNKK